VSRIAEHLIALYGGEPRVRQAMNRFAANVRPGLDKLMQFLADAQA